MSSSSYTGNPIEGFPHPTISPILGILNYETIAEVNLQLNANAASVHSNLGDGAHGLLALTINPAVYNTLSAVALVPLLVPPLRKSTHNKDNTENLIASGKNTLPPTKL
jgi:hypothetical protein